MAVARVIRMDVGCVKAGCISSISGGYDHRAVILRGIKLHPRRLSVARSKAF